MVAVLRLKVSIVIFWWRNGICFRRFHGTWSLDKQLADSLVHVSVGLVGGYSKFRPGATEYIGRVARDIWHHLKLPSFYKLALATVLELNQGKQFRRSVCDSVASQTFQLHLHCEFIIIICFETWTGSLSDCSCWQVCCLWDLASCLNCFACVVLQSLSLLSASFWGSTSVSRRTPRRVLLALRATF